jgi:Ca2+-transporting ATPase
MVALLIATASLYALIGDTNEALTLGGSVLVVLAITLVQQWKTERALAALKDLTSPRAQVIRDGRSLRIPGREVVRGDLVVVSEGDRVPADGRAVEAQNVLVDESLLTGESVPVQKAADSDGAKEGESGVFSGTLVVRGRAVVGSSTRARAPRSGRSGGRSPRSRSSALRCRRRSRPWCGPSSCSARRPARCSCSGSERRRAIGSPRCSRASRSRSGCCRRSSR